MKRGCMLAMILMALTLAPTPTSAQELSTEEMNAAVAGESALTALPFAGGVLLGVLITDLTSNNFANGTGERLTAYIGAPASAFLISWFATWPIVSATIDDDGVLRSAAPWILSSTLGVAALAVFLADPLDLDDRDVLEVLTPTADALYVGASLYFIGALIERSSDLSLGYASPLAIGLGLGGLALGALAGSLLPDSKDDLEEFAGIPMAVAGPMALIGAPLMTLLIDGLQRGFTTPRFDPSTAQITYIGITAGATLFTLITLAVLDARFDDNDNLAQTPEEDEDDAIRWVLSPTGFMLQW